MDEINKQELLTLISRGKPKRAIDLLLSFDFQGAIKKDILGIAAQYQQFLQENRKGILSVEQYKLTQNQLTARLIDIIEHIDNPRKKERKPFLIKNNFFLLLGLLGSIIIFLVGLQCYNHASKVLQLTIFVTDTKGNVVLENQGTLNIPIENRLLHATIGENGRTNFAGIPAKYSDKPIQIGLIAEGWKLIDEDNEFLFTGESIKLKVKRNNSLGMIKGAVKTRDGQSYISGALVHINSDTTVMTDKFGFFKIVLPEHMQVKKETDTYRLTIIKDGYRTLEEDFNPKSSAADIRLERKRIL